MLVRMYKEHDFLKTKGSLWSYGRLCNLCNRCLSPLTLWVRIPLRRGVLDTTLCDKVCQWLATYRWFSPGIPVSSISKTGRYDIIEILLKVTLNTIILILKTTSLVEPELYMTHRYWIVFDKIWIWYQRWPPPHDRVINTSLREEFCQIITHH